MNNRSPYNLTDGTDPIEFPDPKKLSPYDLGDVNRAKRAMELIKFLRRPSILRSKKRVSHK